MIRPQLIVMTLLVLALIAGAVRLANGMNEPIGTLVNVAWVVFDLAILGVLVKAARYKGFDSEERKQDEFHR